MNQHLQEQIETLLARLRDIQPPNPEQLRLLAEKLRFEYNYHSNRLAGNTLSLQETKLLVKFGQVGPGEHLYRELNEMIGHDDALHQMIEWAEDPRYSVTLADIISLHDMILGQHHLWAKISRELGRAPIDKPAAPDEQHNSDERPRKEDEQATDRDPEFSPRKISRLLQMFDAMINVFQNMHPVEGGAHMHYQCVHRHPFEKGNGRLARLLMNYLLLRSGYSLVIIKYDDEDQYLSTLRQADAGDIEPFIDFVGQQLAISLELQLNACQGKLQDPAIFLPRSKDRP